MKLNQFSNEGEAEANAHVGLRRRVVDTPAKGVEDRWEEIGRDTNAVVSDDELGEWAPIPRPQVHLATAGRELDRVFNQVSRNLFEPDPITVYEEGPAQTIDG